MCLLQDPDQDAIPGGMILQRIDGGDLKNYKSSSIICQICETPGYLAGLVRRKILKVVTH